MPGAPFIYYGDEIGMRYVEGLKSVEGGYNRTGSRSPMQWDDSTNAGFSSAPASDLYITMDPGKDRPTAKAQMADPDSCTTKLKTHPDPPEQQSTLKPRNHRVRLCREKPVSAGIRP